MDSLDGDVGRVPAARACFASGNETAGLAEPPIFFADRLLLASMERLRKDLSVDSTPACVRFRGGDSSQRAVSERTFFKRRGATRFTAAAKVEKEKRKRKG